MANPTPSLPPLLDEIAVLMPMTSPPPQIRYARHKAQPVPNYAQAAEVATISGDNRVIWNLRPVARRFRRAAKRPGGAKSHNAPVMPTKLRSVPNGARVMKKYSRRK